MPEAKGRKEGPTTRSRKAKAEKPAPELANVYHEEGNASVSEAYHTDPITEPTPESAPAETRAEPPVSIAEASIAAVVKLPTCASYSLSFVPYGAAAIRDVMSGCGTAATMAE